MKQFLLAGAAIWAVFAAPALAGDINPAKIAEHVKRGVYEAGGFPVEFPVFSNGESNLRPTAMLTRRPTPFEYYRCHVCGLVPAPVSSLTGVAIEHGGPKAQRCSMSGRRLIDPPA